MHHKLYFLRVNLREWREAWSEIIQFVELHYSFVDSAKIPGAASYDLRTLRRSSTTAATKASVSDKTMLHTAPPTPQAQVRGTPIATETQLETVTAAKIRRGASIDRNTIEGPKNALPATDANATTGSK
jgi:hypothetical protein